MRIPATSLRAGDTFDNNLFVINVQTVPGSVRVTVWDNDILKVKTFRTDDTAFITHFASI